MKTTESQLVAKENTVIDPPSLVGWQFFLSIMLSKYNTVLMGRPAFIAFLCLFYTSMFAAEKGNAKQILDRYQALRPLAKDLAMYRLDWADSLDVALKRAVKEKRPICLIIIHAKYGDIASGHC